MDEEEYYMHAGTEESIGTKMISVAGNVRNPGVFEVPFGIKIGDIIEGLAGGVPDGRRIRLIQFGGASGKVAGPDILDKPYTYEDMAANNLMIGSGAILVIDERTSVLDFLRMNQEFFWEESCGQCTPCREGNLHIKIILEKLANGTATKEDIEMMTKMARVMSRTSLCGLGETAQNSLLAAMKLFPEVFEIGGMRA
jgi:protein hymB